MPVFVRISCLILIFGLFSTHSLKANALSLGSQKVIKEKRTVSDFTKVAISGSGQLFIKQGETEALTIEADSHFLPEVKSEVIDKTLHLGPKESITKPLINYYLTVKNIEDIHTAGEIVLSSNGSISAKTLNLVTAGAGKVDLKLKTDTLNIEAAGSSEITLSGTVITQTFKIAGTSKIQSKKLVAKNTQVEIKGAGEAEVNSTETLAVKIEGVGTVKYYGEPKITQEISGAGEIIPL